MELRRVTSVSWCIQVKLIILMLVYGISNIYLKEYNHHIRVLAPSTKFRVKKAQWHPSPTTSIKGFPKTIGWFQIDSFLWRQQPWTNMPTKLILLNHVPLCLWPPQWLWAWRLQCWPQWPGIEEFKFKLSPPRKTHVHALTWAFSSMLLINAYHPGRSEQSKKSKGKLYPCQLRCRRNYLDDFFL